MQMISDDLSAALSLLRVYMGVDKSAGHFTGFRRKLPNAFYVIQIGNLERTLKDAGE
jgi:hypothetical protein